MNHIQKLTLLLLIIPLFSCSTGNESLRSSASGGPSDKNEQAVPVSEISDPDKAGPDNDAADSNAAAADNVLKSAADEKGNDSIFEEGEPVTGKSSAEDEKSVINISDEENTDYAASAEAETAAGSENNTEAESRDAVSKSAGPDYDENVSEYPAALEDKNENPESAGLINSAAAQKDAREDENESSLPVKEGVQRTSGTGWARKIADTGSTADKTQDNPAGNITETGSNEITEKAADREAEKNTGSETVLQINPEEQTVEKSGAGESFITEAEDKKISGTVNNDDLPGASASAAAAVSGIPAGQDESVISADPEEEARAENSASDLPEAETGAASESRNKISDAGYDTKASEYLAALENETENPEEGISRVDRYINGREYDFPFSEVQSSDNAPEEAVKERDKVLFSDPSNIVVVLDGTGWIFLGGEDDRKITFLSRKTDKGKTVFSFSAGSGKVFILNFQFQNTDGSIRNKEVELSAVNPAIQNTAAENPAGPEDGREAEADSELKQDLSSVNDSSVSENDAEGNIQEEAISPLTVPEETDINKLFKEALVLMDKKEYGKAAEKLEKIKNSSFQFPETDRLYFLLGQCYEKNEKSRDPVKAEMYYSMLLDQFPFSLFYDRAEARKRYLLRYFINIR